MRSKGWLAGFVLMLVAAAGFLAVQAGARPEVREIVLVARDMAFYTAGDATPNPVLRLHAGERVRIVLRNETPGIIHDLASDGLGMYIEPLQPGQAGSTELRAPDRPGRHEYRCRPHALMMRGIVEVLETAGP